MGQVLRTGGQGNAYMILDGKLKAKRPLRKMRCTCDDNINMKLKKYKGLEYLGSGQGHVAGCNKPAGPIKKQYVP
jgi:hypothetical protein